LSISHFDTDSDVADIVAAIDRDGAAVIVGAVEAARAAAILDDVDALFGSSDGRDEVHERRLFGDAPLTLDLVTHPQVLDIAAAILGRHGRDFQLGSARAVRHAGGFPEQPMIADATLYPMRIPGMEWLISATWSLGDVDVGHGEPTVLPGSQRWDIMRLPDEANRVAVPMPAGAVLITSGWVLHGFSANPSPTPVHMLACRYSLGWLRSEVNHLLALPEEILAALPETIRRMIGFAPYENGRLGRYLS